MAHKDDDAPEERDELDDEARDDERLDEGEADEGDDADEGEDDADDDDDVDDDDVDDDDVDDDDVDEDDDDDADEGDDEAPPGRRRRRVTDERAADVARALGVGEEDEDEDEEEPEERPLNRAERRRQRALQRRRREGAAASDDEEETVRDRNRRRRQRLLDRRRRAAQAEEAPVPAQLSASEMMDDALARGAAAAVNWIKHNWSVLQWVLVAGVLGGVGLLVWTYTRSEASVEASVLLGDAIEAEIGMVIPPEEDKRTEEEKEGYLLSVFPSEQARRDAAIAAYDAVEAQFAGTGPAILATLGEAGNLLDKREWDAALANYQSVLDTELAAADADARARALEGKGFALESKKDLDGALAAFTALGEVGGDLYAFTSKYHQARIHRAKKDDEKAKALLVELRGEIEKAKLAIQGGESLEGFSPVHPFRWVESAATELLKEIDPSAIPPGPQGGSIPPDKLRELLEQHGAQPELPTP